MLETYYRYRLDYKDYIIFIKVGSFYEVFDKDSLILNELFDYKIKKVKDNIKVGFPIKRIDSIIKLMGNINYVIVDKEIHKREFNDNKYNEYNYDVNKVVLNFIKLERIYNYLMEKVLDTDLLNDIEKLIIGRNIF